MSDSMEDIRIIRKKQYYDFKNKKILKLYYNDLIIEEIINNKLIDKIQSWFREYTMLNKPYSNLEDVIDYYEYDIVKFRNHNTLYGFHYLKLLQSFDLYGYINPKTKQPLNLYCIRRINLQIKQINKYIFKKKNSFKEIECMNTSDIMENILNLFEDRGVHKLKVPLEMFNEMLNLEPKVYAIELFNDKTIYRSYAIFNDFPKEDDIPMELPIGMYNQMKLNPNIEATYKMQIIEPPKGEKIYLRCLINCEGLLDNIKEKMTIELTKHKILSTNQIIVIESDTTYEMIPFRVEKMDPSNICDITNIDLIVDFLDCLEIDNSIEAMILELSMI